MSVEEIKARYGIGKNCKGYTTTSIDQLASDIHFLLFHISTLEERVQLAEATRDDALANVKMWKEKATESEQRMKELREETIRLCEVQTKMIDKIMAE